MRSTRTPRSPSLLAAAAALAALFAVAGGGAGAPTHADAVAAARWRGLVGGERAKASLGQRAIVILKAPSLAQRVTRAGGHATETQMRAWTAAALAAQKELAAHLASEGFPLAPELTFTRVLNGFSAPLDPRGLALLEKDPTVAGVYPVRAAYPASLSSTAIGLAAGLLPRGLALPGHDGAGVTVALLDTGVDSTHPYLRGHVLEGADIVDPEGTPVAHQHPLLAGRPEMHGTELAGLVVGSHGPDGLHGVAPGASILPLRVAGWQPDASGGYAIYARSDQLVAGLERAVDPNADGDAHDAARIALIGLAEPFGGFADGALAQAVEGATELDTLVVAAAGNDGPAGPSYGSIAGPGGAPSALTVGSADGRSSIATVRVLVRAGLDALFDGKLPLGGAVAPGQPVTLALALPGAPDRHVAPDARGFARFFDAQGYSRVAGRAALVPLGNALVQAERNAALAGASAVLLDGVAPAGSLGLDERVDVPVVGLPRTIAREVRQALAAGADVSVSIGVPDAVANSRAGDVAPFSSRGLAYAGGVKPEVVAPGIGLPTSEPGRNDDGTARYGTVNGTSASAALVAGAAAVLAQARPALDAQALRGVLAGTARAQPGEPASEPGQGLLDIGAAAATEVVAEPTSVPFGAVTEPETDALRSFTVRNVSTRRLTLKVSAQLPGVAGVTVDVAPRTLVLARGATAEIKLTAHVAFLSQRLGAVVGTVRVSPVGGVSITVPWAVAFPPPTDTLLSAVRVSTPSFKASDTAPAVLSLRAGTVEVRRGVPSVQPVELLDVELWRGDTRIGLLARLRDLLPGRYAFGLTGRGPRGGRLATGDYTLRIIAVPAGGGDAAVRTVSVHVG